MIKNTYIKADVTGSSIINSGYNLSSSIPNINNILFGAKKGSDGKWARVTGQLSDLVEDGDSSSSSSVDIDSIVNGKSTLFRFILHGQIGNSSINIRPGGTSGSVLYNLTLSNDNRVVDIYIPSSKIGSRLSIDFIGGSGINSPKDIDIQDPFTGLYYIDTYWSGKPVLDHITISPHSSSVTAAGGEVLCDVRAYDSSNNEISGIKQSCFDAPVVTGDAAAVMTDAGTLKVTVNANSSSTARDIKVSLTIKKDHSHTDDTYTVNNDVTESVTINQEASLTVIRYIQATLYDNNNQIFSGNIPSGGGPYKLNLVGYDNKPSLTPITVGGGSVSELNTGNTMIPFKDVNNITLSISGVLIGKKVLESGDNATYSAGSITVPISINSNNSSRSKSFIANITAVSPPISTPVDGFAIDISTPNKVYTINQAGTVSSTVSLSINIEAANKTSTDDGIYFTYGGRNSEEVKLKAGETVSRTVTIAGITPSESEREITIMGGIGIINLSGSDRYAFYYDEDDGNGEITDRKLVVNADKIINFRPVSEVVPNNSISNSKENTLITEDENEVTE